MGNIVEFKTFKSARIPYDETLRDLRISLHKIADEVLDSSIKLATLGRWKEWNDGVPIGECCYFSEEALMQAGDKNVTALIYLLRAIVDTLDWLPCAELTNDKIRAKGVVGHICNKTNAEEALKDPIVGEIVRTLSAEVVGVIKR